MAFDAVTYALAKKYADKKIDTTIESVYKFIGSVDKFEELLEKTPKNGEVYNVREDNMNYAWSDKENRWEALGTNQLATNERKGLITLKDNTFTDTTFKGDVIAVTDTEEIDIPTMLSGIKQQIVDFSKGEEKLVNIDSVKDYVDYKVDKTTTPTIFLKEPTSNPNDFPNVKYGDLCIYNTKIYTPKILGTNGAGVVIFIEWTQIASVDNLAQYVKTVNGQAPDENGNVDIDDEDIRELLEKGAIYIGEGVPSASPVDFPKIKYGDMYFDKNNKEYYFVKLLGYAGQGSTIIFIQWDKLSNDVDLSNYYSKEDIKATPDTLSSGTSKYDFYTNVARELFDVSMSNFSWSLDTYRAIGSKMFDAKLGSTWRGEGDTYNAIAKQMFNYQGNGFDYSTLYNVIASSVAMRTFGIWYWSGSNDTYKAIANGMFGFSQWSNTDTIYAAIASKMFGLSDYLSWDGYGNTYKAIASWMFDYSGYAVPSSPDIYKTIGSKMFGVDIGDGVYFGDPYSIYSAIASRMFSINDWSGVSDVYNATFKYLFSNVDPVHPSYGWSGVNDTYKAIVNHIFPGIESTSYYLGNVQDYLRAYLFKGYFGYGSMPISDMNYEIGKLALSALGCGSGSWSVANDAGSKATIFYANNRYGRYEWLSTPSAYGTYNLQLTIGYEGAVLSWVKQ